MKSNECGGGDFDGGGWWGHGDKFDSRSYAALGQEQGNDSDDKYLRLRLGDLQLLFVSSADF